ncbi:hypothetical protein DFH09DRAFT_1078563 [Mycena vulgaris]|nr:hypothetical protein DFH09DRAFT_1078563 [Mycena vulgaris]
MRECMRNPEVPSYTTTAMVGAPQVIADQSISSGVTMMSQPGRIRFGRRCTLGEGGHQSRRPHVCGMTPFKAYTVQPYMEGRVKPNPDEWPAVSLHSLGLNPMQTPKAAILPASDVLREHGPLNDYWDSVRGSTLEAAIDNLTVHGCIIVCSRQNDNVSVQGFLIANLAAQMAPRFFAEVPALLGKLTCQEHIIKGLENGPAALVGILKDGNAVGRPLIVVVEE